ncbi:MAG: GNAT family N-acetyltransferase [Candidatus Lokiarchaeota archaeon]|nr:GNAT family N-acetyltransferase [Candidatus Lokiarchaeota archaeon]
MEIVRYDPRKDKEEFIKLAIAFSDRSYIPFEQAQFKKEIEQRVLDLKLRNSIILAKEDGKIIGAGTFSPYNDEFGNPHCIIHQVLTYKEDAYTKGIEEAIMRELFKYIKNTMNISKIEILCDPKNSRFQSILMKLGIKRSELLLYEHNL